jgi:general stress protein YciG
MADEATNPGDRMDERSGRNSGAGVGVGNINSLSGGNGSIGGNRNDGGVDNRGGVDTRGSMSRKTPRGFAAMDPQAQRAIAAKGGRAAHQKGTAHEFTSEEARIAGRKGGEASRGGRRSTGSSASNT